MKNLFSGLDSDQFEDISEENSIGQFLGGYGNTNEESASGEENMYILKRGNEIGGPSNFTFLSINKEELPQFE